VDSIIAYDKNIEKKISGGFGGEPKLPVSPESYYQMLVKLKI
jgi:hypothetical protein